MLKLLLKHLSQTEATMMTFLLMMAKYPEWVQRAQSEIDGVMRQERLPTLDDRKDIPIVDCILKEVLR